MYDSGGLEILTERECRELLDGVSLGRVIFTDQALPAIQPVWFLVCDGDVVIRTPAGSKLAAAARNAVVAFEADEFDHPVRDGWSVVVIGHARVIAENGELRRLRSLPLRAWGSDERDYFIAITPERICGRRLPRKC
jgi:nitroimidazol reductase NimA-like FMN-containing flavoprotein (pyridoxamine 5'-phosphate oxidase superfamily)